MQRNFLNLSEKEWDQSIFRVMSIGRLLELFKTEKLTLVKPKLWDDPFENFIMNSTGELSNGEMFSISFRDHFFGQCWTRTRESDAMWRIYSSKKDGVRITSTPRKLLQALYFSPGEFRDITSFIGKVRYFSINKLKILLEENAASWITDTSGVGQAQTLLFKRSPFKYENEVRLIYNSLGKIKGDIYSFPITPSDIIDDIVFDPRIEYRLFKQFKRKIKAYSFKKRIVKSNLYKAPNLTFKMKD